MNEPMTHWKTITIPKMVYLPTGSLNGAFKDTGLRVEPSDKVELLPGSRRIRINGIEHNLLIPADNLPLDANNCLRLDKPAPPVVSLGSGGGSRAYVGATGQARAKAQGNWDHEGASNWKGDEASYVGRDWMHAQMLRADKEGAFEDPDDGLIEDAPLPKTAPNVLDEERVTKTVTLRDGTTAEVLLDPSSGREISTSRAYDGVGINPKEAARMLAEQNAQATDVTHRPEPQRLVPPPQPPRLVPPPPQAHPAVTTGHVDLDGLLQATIGSTGLPLGSLSYVFGNEATTAFLQCPPGSTCKGIEAAFARIHLRNAQEKPLITIVLDMTEPDDALRLSIAEQLPVLAETVKTHGQVAVAILSPDWLAQTPALLNYIPTLGIKIITHERDDRFITTTVTKGAKGAVGTGPSVSFPR